MTAFSLRLTNGANAVSQLHGETARATWHGITDHEIQGLTNGVHGAHLGRRADRATSSKATSGANLDDLDASDPAGSLLGAPRADPGEGPVGCPSRQKRELAEFARRRLRNQFARHGEAPGVLAELETALDPNVLTIGFARRFATYKRAGLLFSDMDRLAKLLWDADRPVQVVFAGKAHPADRPGQRVIQEIFQRSRSPPLRGRVFIMENYDMRVGAVPRAGRGCRG